MDERVKPATLFRFESFNALSLQKLKAGRIYFSHPNAFNDSYDCRLPFQLAAMTDDDAMRIKRHKIDGAPTKEERVEAQRMSASDAAAKAGRMVRELIDYAKKAFMADNGVARFTERNDSLLMWGHYGGRFKGYCLEFRTSHDPFRRIHKVNYSEKIPKLDIADLYINSDDAGKRLLEVYCTESKDWEYEREWRAIHKSSGRPFTYDQGALKAVYFGPEIDREAWEIICLIMAEQHEGVELWMGRRSEEEFKVVFDQFKYDSHLAAKQLSELPVSP